MNAKTLFLVAAVMLATIALSEAGKTREELRAERQARIDARNEARAQKMKQKAQNLKTKIDSKLDERAKANDGSPVNEAKEKERAERQAAKDAEREKRMQEKNAAKNTETAVTKACDLGTKCMAELRTDLCEKRGGSVIDECPVQSTGSCVDSRGRCLKDVTKAICDRRKGEFEEGAKCPEPVTGTCVFERRGRSFCKGGLSEAHCTRFATKFPSATFGPGCECEGGEAVNCKEDEEPQESGGSCTVTRENCDARASNALVSFTHHFSPKPHGWWIGYELSMRTDGRYVWTSADEYSQRRSAISWVGDAVASGDASQVEYIGTLGADDWGRSAMGMHFVPGTDVNIVADGTNHGHGLQIYDIGKWADDRRSGTGAYADIEHLWTFAGVGKTMHGMTAPLAENDIPGIYPSYDKSWTTNGWARSYEDGMQIYKASENLVYVYISLSDGWGPNYQLQISSFNPNNIEATYTHHRTFKIPNPRQESGNDFIRVRSPVIAHVASGVYMYLVDRSSGETAICKISTDPLCNDIVNTDSSLGSLDLWWHADGENFFIVRGGANGPWKGKWSTGADGQSAFKGEDIDAVAPTFYVADISDPLEPRVISAVYANVHMSYNAEASDYSGSNANSWMNGWYSTNEKLFAGICGSSGTNIVFYDMSNPHHPYPIYEHIMDEIYAEGNKDYEGNFITGFGDLLFSSHGETAGNISGGGFYGAMNIKGLGKTKCNMEVTDDNFMYWSEAC